MPYFENPNLIEIVTMALAVLGLILIVVVWIKVGRIRKIQKTFLSGRQGSNLEELILEHDGSLQKIVGQLKDLLEASEELALRQQFSIQKAGLVRFNQFGETGGHNSFALALLDSRKNGVVISALGNRDSQRIFVKDIHEGTSRVPLTEEEKQAIIEGQRGESLAAAPPEESPATPAQTGELARMRRSKILRSKK